MEINPLIITTSIHHPRFLFVRRGVRNHPAGFALVVTLSLMILLLVLAVGLLQLSAISLRNSDTRMRQAEAQTNARVAMMMALAQLQLEMGPDSRVSATAGVLDTDSTTPAFDGVAQPRLTGAWTAAASRVTDFTLDSNPPPKTFRSWLVSGAPAVVEKIDMAKNPYSAVTPSRRLVADGSDLTLKRGVSVPVLSGNKAGFAWWTSDNGVKAVLRAGEKPDTLSSSRALLGLRRPEADGHAVLDPTKFPDRTHGLDQRLVDLPAVDTAKPGAAGEERVGWKLLHDLTTRSESVPVDVTTGSLRNCLNTRLDWLEAQSPAVRAAEGTFGKLGVDPITNTPIPTQDYRLFAWDQLRNYESLARSAGMMTLNSDGRPQIRCHKQNGFRGTLGEPEWNPHISEHRFRVQPVLLKLGMAVSYATERIPPPTDPNIPYDPNKPLALRLYVYPMMVLWNPYNVDLMVPEYLTGGHCPLTFSITTAASGTQVLDLTKTQTAINIGFGPEMGGTKRFSNQVIPAGATMVLYAQPVRLDTTEHQYEHRHYRFPWVYYIWGETGKFTLGSGGNFGGVIKNLKPGSYDGRSLSSFNPNYQWELWGGAEDTVSMTAEPSKDSLTWTFGASGAHTDWWGNNGSGTDDAETLEKFGLTTTAKMRVESSGETPQISILKPGEVPVRTFGQLEGTPTPLLYFEYYRKAADEDLFPAKHHSFSMAGNPIHGLTCKALGTSDTVTPWFESPYSFRFKAINSWFDVTKTFQLPPDRDDRIYFGASYSPRGQLNVIDQEIPVTPLVSLAQLQHLPLFDYRPVYDPVLATFNTPQWYIGDYWFHEGRATQFAQNHAIGNSFASPGIPSDRIHNPGWRHLFNATANHLRVDRSYIANSLLWDAWFCSSVAAQDGLLLQTDGTQRTARKVFEDFLATTRPLPNDAMRACLTRPATEVTPLLFDAGGKPLKDACTRIAEFLRVENGFNINSVSEEAWAHFLAGLLSRPSMVMESVTGTEAPAVLAREYDKFLITRHTLANAPPAERTTGQGRENRYWNCSREITAAQIRELAAAIVRQVKKRGPFTSLAEFVNRRPGYDTRLATSGALQSALDDPAVSINEPFRGDSISGAELTTAGKPVYPFPDAAKGPRRQGITGYVTQADLLASVGPAISARSDTFTIRALGESRNNQGEILARAWCEAVVQRTSSYIDPRDPATTAFSALVQPANKRLGRRFEIVSFRWLDRREVEKSS